MLLTLPVLYYKPIQEQALKIKASIKGRREDKWQGEQEKGGRVVQETWEFKSNTVSFMFKGTFLFQ